MAPLGSSAAGRYHAQGTSVMEEDWGEYWLITPPTNLAGRESNREPVGYKSDALTAHPRLPYSALLAGQAIIFVYSVPLFYSF
ncbi:MAG: hypothetical protein GY820_34410, partial [Gammaproteobacteria bacterium]|nr:hypothetical protein [Gammaproteobacteria bacterium]